jgi:uncharacterized protein YggE
MRLIFCVWMAVALAVAAVDSASARERGIARSDQTQEPRPPEPPTVVTAGEAIVRRAPDVAFVTLSVESRARSPRDAQRQNADAMNAVQKRLTDAGIARDALRTLGVSLDQDVDVVNGRRVPREFVARNSIEVRLDDVARAGEIADIAVQGGATSLSGIRFDLKDRAAAEREALRNAVANARGRAEAAAAGAGRTIDRIVKIEDSRSEPIVRPMITMRSEGQIATATPVEPGMIEIRAAVVLTAVLR